MHYYSYPIEKSMRIRNLLVLSQNNKLLVTEYWLIYQVPSTIPFKFKVK